MAHLLGIGCQKATDRSVAILAQAILAQAVAILAQAEKGRAIDPHNHRGLPNRTVAMAKKRAATDSAALEEPHGGTEDVAGMLEAFKKEVVTKSELAEMLDAFMGSHGGLLAMNAKVDGAVESLKEIQGASKEAHAALRAETAKLITKVDSRNQKRFNSIEVSVSELQERVAHLEKEQKKSFEKVASLATQMARMETLKPQQMAIDEDDFNRATNPTIVRLRTAEATTKTMALESVKDILDAMGVPSGEPPADLAGPELGRNFTLRFRGAEGLAAQRVRKFMASQRTGEGWRQMEAPVPGGGKAKVYLDFDKNK